jgi:hypothetical protein
MDKSDARERRLYYLARVEISPKGLEDLKRQKLNWLQPAEVLINTGADTLRLPDRSDQNTVARSFIED